MSRLPEYFLCFYVPEDHAENVKNALFEAGAGRLGDYENCCWETLGQGQFRPLADAKPFIGEQNRLEQIQELKIEMICRKDVLKAAVEALKKAHPYEEPAFHVMKFETGF